MLPSSLTSESVRLFDLVEILVLRDIMLLVSVVSLVVLKILRLFGRFWLLRMRNGLMRMRSGSIGRHLGDFGEEGATVVQSQDSSSCVEKVSSFH